MCDSYAGVGILKLLQSTSSAVHEWTIYMQEWVLSCYCSGSRMYTGVVISKVIAILITEGLWLYDWHAGVGYTTDDFTGALVFDPLIEKSFDLYFTRFLSPRCQVGTHISRLYEKGLTSAKVASSYVYNSQTTLKGRFDDKGLVAGLLQFSPNPLVTFSLLAEVNSRDLKAQPNVGLSLSVLSA